jgi:saccharopine dehydrogenase-like NADP-dependent oxidoreductase
MNKRQIMIVGAGKIGSMIAALLAESGDYCVAIADRDPAQLDRIDGRSGISKALVDVGAGTSALAELLRGKFAVLSAAPYHLTIGVA